MSLYHALASAAGLGCLIIALVYSTGVLAARLRWWYAARSGIGEGFCEAASVLKPLCGAETGLYENLRSFCTQDYPAFEIILGVQCESDPALPVARRVAAEFPALPITIVVDERSHGTNRKVSNLLNMVTHARHDIWVFADSDAEVGPDYLGQVTRPLADPRVGLVTCTYRDAPSPNLWSRLAAMYVNDWFMPSVILAWALGRRDYVSGQTMCVRRGTVQAIGGLGALANRLADDYVLGDLVRRCGLSVVLSHYLPRARHHEPSFASLVAHEVRWMRTIAVLKPASFRLLFLSFSLPLALVGLLLAAPEPVTARPAQMLALVILALRIGHHGCTHRDSLREFFRGLYLIPVRDLLIAYVWARGLRASRVVWRGIEFQVGHDGLLRSVVERSA